MIQKFIITLALLSLITDIVIYLQLRKRFADKPWLKRGYLILVAIVDAMMLLTLLSIKSSFVATGLPLMMWVIWGFIAFSAPKLIYIILSWPDYFIRRRHPKRRRTFSVIGLAAALAIFGYMLFGATIGRNRFRTEEVTITSAKIPAAFDGYRIAQISDIHLGNYSEGNDIVERLVARINELAPDLIVISGDIVNSNSRELTDRYMHALSGLKAENGVWFSLGNHDLGLYMFDDQITAEQSLAELKSKIAQMGWRLLDNESVYITRGGDFTDSITLSGVGYPSHGRHNGRSGGTVLSEFDLERTYDSIDTSKFNILIAHTPEVWDEVLAGGVTDLTLSGHVHAMQWKVNLFGWRWSPAKWMYSRWSGLYEQSDKYLYINDGIGYVMLPMRLGTRPEITMFTLKPAIR